MLLQQISYHTMYIAPYLLPSHHTLLDHKLLNHTVYRHSKPYSIVFRHTTNHHISPHTIHTMSHHTLRSTITSFFIHENRQRRFCPMDILSSGQNARYYWTSPQQPIYILYQSTVSYSRAAEISCLASRKDKHEEKKIPHAHFCTICIFRLRPLADASF